MRSLVIRDIRSKEKFQVDDMYLNGYAKILKPATTAVYLSLCRHADSNQKSFPSIKLIGEQHSISISTVQRSLKKLVAYNIIDKERTKSSTGKWLNNTYYLLDKSVWKKAIGHARPLDKPQVISDKTTGHFRYTKDTHKKDTHTLSIARSNSLKNIKEEELIRISNFYNVPMAFVKSKYDDLINYCERTGRHYKNYLAALRNFVKQDAIKIRKEERQHESKRGIDFTNLS